VERSPSFIPSLVATHVSVGGSGGVPRWTGPLIEFYPKTHRIGWVDGQPAFVVNEARATGAGTHFNITVDKTREQIEAVCEERGLEHAWRDWASFVDVLLEDGLVVEIVPG